MFYKRHYNWEAPQDDWVIRVDQCPLCRGSRVITSSDGERSSQCPECEGRGELTKRVPPCIGIEILNTGTTDRQNFSPRFVTQFVQEGWMTMEGERILLHTMNAGDLEYRIEVHPGRYCCHCYAKLPDDPRGELARLHVAQHHAGIPSPDDESPAGYCQVNAFLCQLRSDQHEKHHHRPIEGPPKPDVKRINLRAGVGRRAENG